MYQQTIPLIIMLAAILAGILLNNKNSQELKADFQREIKRLDDKIDSTSASLNAKIDSTSASLNTKIDSIALSLHERLNVIDADLRQFYHLNGKLEGRIDSLEKRLS